MIWRLCWGCGTHINPLAPHTSAAYGEAITVIRLDGSSNHYHAHTACLELHSIASFRPEWTGRLSTVLARRERK